MDHILSDILETEFNIFHLLKLSSLSMNQCKSVFRLIYRSKPSSKWKINDLISLMQYSSAKNETLGIRGLLLVTPNDFLQVLEGPEDNVLYTFESIRDDKRHTKVDLMLQAKNVTPLFTQWFMKGVSLSPVQDDVLELLESKYEYSQSSGLIIPHNPTVALGLLVDLYQLYSSRDC